LEDAPMLYEVRTYTLRPGTVAEFEERFAKRLPLREKHSKLGAFWHTEFGPLNQVIHVYPYDDLQQRTTVRAALAQDTARFAMQLQRPVGPHLGWSILLVIGFLGWVGATVCLIWYVVDGAGNFARRQGLLWGSLMAVFFTLWLIGMRLT